MKKKIYLLLFSFVIMGFSIHSVGAIYCWRVCYEGDCIYNGRQREYVVGDGLDKYDECYNATGNQDEDSECGDGLDFTEENVVADDCYSLNLKENTVDTSEYQDKYNNVIGKIHNNGDNYDEGNIVSCGEELLTDIPMVLPKIIHLIYLLIQIALPIIIVIFGSLDFLKAVLAQKDDEIRKGQQTFIKRLITGFIVFFVFAIVKFIISVVGEDNKVAIIDCASCFINNDDNCVK